MGLLKTKVPFDEVRIKKSIDFRKLTPAQFYDKYKLKYKEGVGDVPSSS